ncbi:MAG: endolytic transglycosylase MltG [Patescibacteria group bacterium]
MEINDKSVRFLTIGIGAFLFLTGVVFYIFFSIPADFPSGRVITIEKGLGLSRIADYLLKERAIKFPLVFKMLVAGSVGQTSVKAGNYFFEKPLSMVEIYRRLTEGIYGLSAIKITVLEGWTARQIGDYFEKTGFFSSENWLKSAEKEEGYLFPDTYFFDANGLNPETVAKTMRENFEKKITPEIMAEIEQRGKNLKEIIIMASLIEKEMSSPGDARIISGILWKRFEAKMGLQADATLVYLTGKPSLKLTEEDLAVDSPYNTYKYRGLPPGPISNPGFDAIKAAIFPEKTLYWYYLHDGEGRPHYGITFEEHIANKQKYLK